MDSPKEFTTLEWCAGYAGIQLGLKRAIPNVRTVAYSEREERERMSKKINDGLTASQRYRLRHKDTDEYKERQREAQKKWRANNSERAKEIGRAHYARNKEQMRKEAVSRFQRFKESGYSDRRRETQRVNCHKRRTAAKCDNPLTNEQWLGILCAADHKCCKCGSREDLTIDHIIPVSRGGLHTANNVQVLCRPCNSSKGVKCG